MSMLPSGEPQNRRNHSRTAGETGRVPKRRKVVSFLKQGRLSFGLKAGERGWIEDVGHDCKEQRESERESSRPRNSSKNQKGCELVDDLELLLAIKKE